MEASLLVSAKAGRHGGPMSRRWAHRRPAPVMYGLILPGDTVILFSVVPRLIAEVERC